MLELPGSQGRRRDKMSCDEDVGQLVDNDIIDRISLRQSGKERNEE